MYKYRITEEVDSREKFQKGRIAAFDSLESQIQDLRQALKKAKNETIRYYRENPGHWAVVYGTDLIQEYINDIKTLLKQEDREYEN